jgi:hypothetical protein
MISMLLVLCSSPRKSLEPSWRRRSTRAQLLKQGWTIVPRRWNPLIDLRRGHQHVRRVDEHVQQIRRRHRIKVYFIHYIIIIILIIGVDVVVGVVVLQTLDSRLTDYLYTNIQYSIFNAPLLDSLME